MFVLLLVLILVLIYYYLTKNHGYWEKHKVKHDKPVPFFGNLYSNVTGKKSTSEIATALYYKYPNEKVVGFYHGTVPELIIRDVDIAKKILNVDFTYFNQRGIGRNCKREAIFKNIFHAEGDLWKLLRQSLSGAFTTAKLKKMFPLIVECAKKVQSVGDNIVKNGGECDVRDIMARFTTQFIGVCGFGLDVDAINNEDCPLRKLGKLIFDRNKSWNHAMLVILVDLLPDFEALWQTLFVDNSVEKECMDMLEQVLEQRNYKPSQRHDFIDLLMEIAEKGKITCESMERRGSDGSPVKVEMEMDRICMVAQVFIFFAAGFETSSSATSYLLHELAYHPEEQKKIQENIDQALAKYDNKLCYDSVCEMSALSLAFKESMRKFPPVGILQRVCAKQYTIEELGITIDPGVKIIIPIQAIQTDEKYYKNPFEFIHDRFSNNSEQRNKYTYLPFGEGPRMCVGGRIGEMQSLAGLAAVLQKFSVEPAPSTRRVPEIDPYNNIVQGIKGGLPLRLSLRKKDVIT